MPSDYTKAKLPDANFGQVLSGIKSADLVAQGSQRLDFGDGIDLSSIVARLGEQSAAIGGPPAAAESSDSVGNEQSTTESANLIGNSTSGEPSFSGSTSSVGSTSGSGNRNYSQYNGMYVSKDAIKPQALADMIRPQIEKSSLKGFVPEDGEKFGIKEGTSEEWSRFLIGLADAESGFRPTRKGDVGRFAGDSNGIFQLSPNDALNHKLQDTPYTIEQLQDPAFNTQEAIKIFEKLVTEDGVIAGGSKKGASRYWGPLRRGYNPTLAKSAQSIQFTPERAEVHGPPNPFAIHGPPAPPAEVHGPPADQTMFYGPSGIPNPPAQTGPPQPAPPQNQGNPVAAPNQQPDSTLFPNTRPRQILNDENSILIP